ncbi:MAG: glutamate--tRNA ligase [bacterium]
MNMFDIRVRFAPSPTGYLHIGGARTALFNWLFARKMKGSFILRIEDTDEKRSTPESTNAILEGMKWLGLSWDEGPYYQMERLEIYTEWLNKLISLGRAYPCWCTKDELDAMRSKAIAEKKPVLYDKRCLNLSDIEKKQKKDAGLPCVMRFNVHEGDDPAFTDVIHGEKKFDSENFEDFIIIKSTGGPTYNFAAVIDDHLMKITHVIRGDDHLSNTPRQVLIYRALGFTIPVFAHLAMILGKDGSRLSKRHGATALSEYMEAGYLAEALRNYLALLGWSTSESQQIFIHNELTQKFSLDRCSKSPSIFDQEKLQWMNGEYIRHLSPEKFAEIGLRWLEKKGLYSNKTDKLFAEDVVKLEQEKIKLFSELPEKVSFMLKDDITYETEAVKKWFGPENQENKIPALLDTLKSLPDFTSAKIEESVRAFAKKNKLKTALIFHPLRVAVSGRTTGPSLFQMIELLGREKVVTRLEYVLREFGKGI